MSTKGNKPRRCHCTGFKSQAGEVKSTNSRHTHTGESGTRGITSQATRKHTSSIPILPWCPPLIVLHTVMYELNPSSIFPSPLQATTNEGPFVSDSIVRESYLEEDCIFRFKISSLHREKLVLWWCITKQLWGFGLLQSGLPHFSFDFGRSKQYVFCMIVFLPVYPLDICYKSRGLACPFIFLQSFREAYQWNR
ncbi:hypothetical protein J6590_100550 [Homalodisca vitripennis]|nr:hypothetical protein J6590_100550 [Homalodisca vitripennis]